MPSRNDLQATIFCSAMVLTPWGRGEDLRGRMLGSGRRAAPEETARNQRERLYGAMVAVCTERGYESTTVSDLIALAGVSRRDFYKHFADKEACFLATLDAILSATARATASRLQSSGSVRERARKGALRALVELVVAQPAAARLCLVEAYAAGPAAVARVDGAMTVLQGVLQRGFEEMPGHREMPPEMTRAMVDGVRKIVHTRLHRGAEAELGELVPDLLELVLSYQPPPRPLSNPARRKGGPDGSRGGRRPEATLIRRGEEPGERITRATMSAVARNGFQSTTIADIAEEAGVSLSTFYAHFESKAQAFDAALYSGRTRLLGVTMPAYRRGRNWPEAIRSVAQTSLAFLAEEPEFARLATVDVYAAGAQALERRDQALEAMAQPLELGQEYAPKMKPIARETIISSVYAMLCDWVREEGTETLPEMAPMATYMTLCPFLGPEQAWKVARSGSRARTARRNANSGETHSDA